jgi:hypothetical protein
VSFDLPLTLRRTSARGAPARHPRRRRDPRHRRDLLGAHNGKLEVVGLPGNAPQLVFERSSRAALVEEGVRPRSYRMTPAPILT